MEKVPYTPKARKPRKRRKYEKLFDRCLELKRVLISSHEIANQQMIRSKTDMTYDRPEFKELVKAGKQIQNHEIRCLLGFIGFVGLNVSVLALIIAFSGNWLWALLFGVAVAVPMVLCFPQMSYERFFKEIYLPICYHCANVMDKKDDLSFELKDKKIHTPVAMGGREVTNTFHIRTGDSESVVKRLIIRDRIPTYNMYKGKLMISSKVATIFSGYSFEMNMKQRIKKDIKEEEPMAITVINNNTFYRQHGLSSEEQQDYDVIRPRFRELDKYCTMYVHKGFDFDKKKWYELEKKMMEFTRELGDFSLYIGENTVRILMNVQNNREGLEVEFFQTSLKHTSGLSYNGFFSIVKTLYVLACLERIMNAIFGKERTRQQYLALEK